MTQKNELKTYEILKSIYFQIKDSFYSIENDNLDNTEVKSLIEDTLEEIYMLNKYVKKLNIYEMTFDMHVLDIANVKENIKYIKEGSSFIENDLLKIQKFVPKVDSPKQGNQTPPEMWEDFERENWEKHIKYRQEEAIAYSTEESETLIEL